jgi:hypothetical protein
MWNGDSLCSCWQTYRFDKARLVWLLVVSFVGLNKGKILMKMSQTVEFERISTDSYNEDHENSPMMGGNFVPEIESYKERSIPYPMASPKRHVLNFFKIILVSAVLVAVVVPAALFLPRSSPSTSNGLNSSEVGDAMVQNENVMGHMEETTGPGELPHAVAKAASDNMTDFI